jgi:hypothetical protein
VGVFVSVPDSISVPNTFIHDFVDATRNILLGVGAPVPMGGVKVFWRYIQVIDGFLAFRRVVPVGNLRIPVRGVLVV